MSTPEGWYPDPAGDKRLVRYWDGAQWTQQTRPLHATPAPEQTTGTSQPLSAPAAPRRRSTLRPMLIALAVVAALMIGFAAWRLSRPAPGAATEPTSSISGWDETSVPSSSAAPSPSDSVPGRPIACEMTSPNQLDDPSVAGGRMSVGNLSMPVPEGWIGPSGEGRVPGGRDAWAYSFVLPEKLGWASSMTLGVLDEATTKGRSPEAVARGVVQCILTSQFYVSVDVKLVEYDATSIKIGSTDAVQADALITFKHENLKTTGSRLRLVIVETPTPQFFFSAVPKERKDHSALVDTTTDGLKVEP